MLACQHHLFDIPDGVAYLNCAYMSPLLKSALEAGTTGLARKARPWKLTADQFFTGSEEFRTTAAQILGCSADCIAIVSSAGYGIQTAAGNLPVRKGRTILVLAEQFPSNYYPWQPVAEESGASLKVVPWPDDYDAGARRFDMGERSNFALLPAAIRAMQQILDWNVAEISETSGALNRRLAEASAELGFSAPSEPLRAPHYLCLRRKAAIPKELTEMLGREKVFVSVRGSSIRVTPHVYNTVEDCDRLIACLRRVA